MSTDKNVPVVVVDAQVDDGAFARSARQDGPVLGQWYWLKDGAEPHYSEKDGLNLIGHHGRLGSERLMCAMDIGSNYVALESPHGANNSGCYTARIHFKDFWKKLRHEPDAERLIEAWAREQQRETKRLLAEIQAVTQRLGMAPRKSIEHVPGSSVGGALVALSSAPDVSGYKAALVLAKEKTLPELYEHVKASNSNLASLLRAQALPTLASVGDMKETVKEIDSRIFSISLYAGLQEDAMQVQGGEPAAADEKLHVMQSRLYMDEECLANYRHGGMHFETIGEFDQWLCEPENLQRILPFPRTLVAMQVRRFTMDRSDCDLSGIARVQMERADKQTFLYIRNGQQVWCIQTELEFDESIFPDRSAFDPNEPKMAHVDHREVKGFIGRSAWEHMCASYDERVAKEAAWNEEHKDELRNKDWACRNSNPYSSHWDGDPRKKYQPVDHTSVYYDDAMALIDEQVQKYNRVAVIIQGLFDRSPILHPHPPVKTWTADGFDAAITLVYDGADTLSHGEAPDFEAYRARCNASLGVGSLTIGQEEFWERREAERDNDRRAKDYRLRDSERHRERTRYRPYGNPGPGYIARVESWSRKKGATYRWDRQRLRDPGYWKRNKGHVGCVIVVPPEHLFNVDAYQLGDFRQFFADRRTRAQYLKWAPMLIAAEEHHAKMKESQ